MKQSGAINTIGTFNISGALNVFSGGSATLDLEFVGGSGRQWDITSLTAGTLEIQDKTGGGKTIAKFSSSLVTLTNMESLGTAIIGGSAIAPTNQFQVNTASSVPAMAVQTNGQVILGSGSLTAPVIGLGSKTNTGLFYNAGAIGVSQTGAGVAIFGYDVVSQVKVTSAGQFDWSSTTSLTAGSDTGIHRSSAGVVEIDNGTTGTYRDLIARAIVFNQIQTIPTNSIPSSSSSVTNWVLMNLTNSIGGGGPIWVATNYTASGSFMLAKPTLTPVAWP